MVFSKMKKFIGNLKALFIFALVTPLTIHAANDGLLSFTGKAGFDGLTSSSGSTNTAVYLNWSTVEGKLPDDIALIRLFRNGDKLLEFTPNAIMSASEISNLYKGSAQEQRYLQSLVLLQEEAATEGTIFDSGEFANQLHNKISSQPVWAHLAAKNDFNIARASYRAFLDYPGAGQFSYELVAYNANQDVARLGFIELDTNQPSAVAEFIAPANFMQILQSSCDTPDYAKDHHTVWLNWSVPGENVADQLASQITISGYDLYRGTTNLAGTVTQAPELNIAELARKGLHDERGLPIIAGLEKVNDVPILTADNDVNSPEFLETLDVLAQAGLMPGDRRAYYLVAKDLAGHYSATASTIVEIPDLVRPPMPWHVWTFPGRIDDKESMILQWDAINLENYRRAYNSSQHFCNLDSVEESGTLQVVGENQNCTTDPRRSIKVNAVDYLVYRFDTFDAASRFKDSDGDGIADEDEAGSQCQTASQNSFSGALLDPSKISLEELTLADGRTSIRLQDSSPAENKNRVYWYRVASKSASGRVSVLSPPHRALYPDRSLPEKPEPVITRSDLEPVGCKLEVVDENANWKFEDGIKLSTTVDFLCGSQKDYTNNDLKRFENVPTQDLLNANSAQCQNQVFVSSCSAGNIRLLGYQDDARGGFSCSVVVDPSVPGFCGGFVEPKNGHLRLVLDSNEREVTVEERAPKFEIKVPHVSEDSCVSLFKHMNGSVTRVASSCDSPDASELVYEVERGTFCGFAVAQDENNNISAPAYMPCLEVADKESPTQLSAPQPVSLELTDNQALINWRLPKQSAASSLVELSRIKPAPQPEVKLITQPAMVSGDGVLDLVVELESAVADIEEWCVRFKTLGQDGNESSWSATQCELRSTSNDEAALPKNIPWPSIAPVHQASDLIAKFSGAFVPDRVLASNLLIQLSGGVSYSQNCVTADTEEVNGVTQNLAFANIACSDAGRLEMTQDLGGKLNFIVYRQHRNAQGEESAFTQVSPIIEYMHWDAVNPAVVFGALSIKHSANDPYIKLFREDTKNDEWNWAFVDQYPYLSGKEYRYQVVYFSPNGEIKQWRQTNWIETQSLLNLSQVEGGSDQ